MSRENRIFKAFLQIKKSFKSITRDLAKDVVVSLPTHFCTGWVNFE